jgi:predicted GNAT family N-acyltransferase
VARISISIPRSTPSSTEGSSLSLTEFDGIAADGAHAPDLAACRALRRIVFIDEQGVPEALEWDGLDAEARHFLARARRPASAPVALGTARMRIVDGYAKAERVAVRQDARTRGVGRFLMLAVEAHARRRELPAIVLHAQVTAIPFYERLGYRAHGGIFLSAGIDHREMTKDLS